MIEIASLRGLDAHVAALADVNAAIEQLNADAAGAVFTDAQKAEFEGLLKQRGDLGAAIEELEARNAAVAAAVQTPEKGSAVSATYGVPNVRKSIDNIFDLSAYRQKVGSIDELPGALRDGAMRVIDGLAFPTVAKLGKNVAEAKDRLKVLVDDHKDENYGWISNRIIGTSSPAYREAWAEAMKGHAVQGRMQALLQTYSDSDGGVAIPVQIDPTFINTSDGSVNPLRAISRIEQITGKTWSPVTTAGMTAAYVGERTTTGASDGAPTDFDNPEVTPVRADVSADATLENLQDYGAAKLESELGTLVQNAKDDLEADKFVNGDGSGEPSGVVKAIIDDTTSIVTTTTNDAFVRADIAKLTGALPDRFEPRARFLAHKAIYELIRAMGTAGEPYGPLSAPDISDLVGYPRHKSSAMDSVTTDAKHILLFGDFGYFVIVDRLGLTSKVMDARDTNGRPTGNSTYYFAWRNGTKVLTFNAFRLLEID